MLWMAALLMLLAACGSTEGAKNPAAQDPTVQDEAAPKDKKGSKGGMQKKKKEVAIRELYSEEGTFDDGLTYSYHVPQIAEDTTGAQEINGEILQYHGKIVKGCLTSMEDGDEPEYVAFAYETFQYEDVLSLVLCYESPYEDASFYESYLYDVKKGKRLFYEDILSMKNLTEEQYLDAIRRAAARFCDQCNLPEGGTGYDIDPEDYYALRAMTISDGYIAAYLPLYLDEDGQIHVFTSVYMFAGSGCMQVDLVPDVGKRESAQVSADYEKAFYATLKDGELSLRIEKNAVSEEILQDNGIDFGAGFFDRELPVAGLYSEYADVFVGALYGMPEMPFVFLLTKEGRVEYVDVITCIKSSYYCAAGPLTGLKEITGFQAENVQDSPEQTPIMTIFGVCKDGSRVDLMDYIQAVRCGMPVGLTGDWSCYQTADNEAENFVALRIEDCDGVELAIYRDARNLLEGRFYLRYLGMTESGLVYGYESPGYDEEAVRGAVAMYEDYHENENGRDSVLFVTEMGGVPMIGSGTGEVTMFDLPPDEKG